MKPTRSLRVHISGSLTVAIFIGIALVQVRAASVLGNPAQGGKEMAFSVSSPSFQNGEAIPKKFTCEGADVSPELDLMAPPAGTHSFALIADDPDAPIGTWTHWVAYDFPADTKTLAEGVPKVDEIPSGGSQGRNDFKKIGYGGPCPPAGKAHRYFFRVYALGTKLNLKPGASRQEVEQAMQGHVLGTAEWMGTYKR